MLAGYLVAPAQASDNAPDEIERLVREAFFKEQTACPPSGHAPGFGSAEQTGATQDRQIFWVRNMQDGPPNTTPGSLRAAVQNAKRARGGVIRFDLKSMGEARITLVNSLAIPSDTIIDGECRGVTIEGQPEVNLMAIHNVRNVTVRGLSFRKLNYDPESKSARDAISISGAFEGIWIDRNRFSRCGDGCIDVVRISSGQLTISHNLFFDHNKTMLLGNLPCTEGASSAPCSPQNATTTRPSPIKLALTLFNNVFYGVGQRNPKLVGGVFVHAVNNIVLFRPYPYSGNRSGASYGIFALEQGQVDASDNLFLALDRRGARADAIGASIPSTGRSAPVASGFVRATRNLALRGEKIASLNPDQVEQAVYPQPLNTLALAPEHWRPWAVCILARATGRDCP